MKLKKLVDLFDKAIPKKDTWGGSELYSAYGTEGLQDKEVNRILYCVTATDEVVKYFKENNYDILVSHHPFLVSGIPHLVYHTALDCCKGGLNDMWRDHLEIKDAKHFDQNLGWFGEIEPILFSDLVEKVEAFAGGDIYDLKSPRNQDDLITSVVVCTGLGGLVFETARATNADCYILGELMGSQIVDPENSFKAIIETGHTRSEFMGVEFFKALLQGTDVVAEAVPMESDYFGSNDQNEHYDTLGSKWGGEEENTNEIDTLDSLWAGNDFALDYEEELKLKKKVGS